MSGSLTTRVAIGIVQSAERWHARSGYGHGKLIEHPHLHCIVPGGELSDDGMRWIASREKFFLPVHVLSQVFRGKFLDELKSAYKAKRLRFLGRAEQLSQQCEFQRLVDRLYSKAWVVYAKQPFGGPK